MEDFGAMVWHSPTTGECRWQGHLLIDQPKLRGKWRTCYTLKMLAPYLSPVQVQHASASKTNGWEVLLWGDTVGTYDTKFDAQRAAEDLLQVGWRHSK
jgi:hypothetical protein